MNEYATVVAISLVFFSKPECKERVFANECLPVLVHEFNDPATTSILILPGEHIVRSSTCCFAAS